MKTYVLTLSHSFPANHAMHGKPTYFREKFLGTPGMLRKLHTIRANYTLWAKRFEKIAAGEACLSVREWTGAPYRSKQKELARLTHEDGIGIQKLQLEVADKLFGKYHARIDDGCGSASIIELATNDGLSLEDWKEWFKTKSRVAIVRSKVLEKKIDQEIERVEALMNPQPNENQLKLFDNEQQTEER